MSYAIAKIPHGNDKVSTLYMAPWFVVDDIFKQQLPDCSETPIVIITRWVNERAKAIEAWFTEHFPIRKVFFVNVANAVHENLPNELRLDYAVGLLKGKFAECGAIFIAESEPVVFEAVAIALALEDPPVKLRSHISHDHGLFHSYWWRHSSEVPEGCHNREARNLCGLFFHPDWNSQYRGKGLRSLLSAGMEAFLVSGTEWAPVEEIQRKMYVLHQATWGIVKFRHDHPEAPGLVCDLTSYLTGLPVNMSVFCSMAENRTKDRVIIKGGVALFPHRLGAWTIISLKTYNCPVSHRLTKEWEKTEGMEEILPGWIACDSKEVMDAVLKRLDGS